jgi:hypothetical protein
MEQGGEGGVKEWPGCVHEDGQGQGMQVSLVEAPGEIENVPMGHGIGLIEERGQYEPAGQSTGTPEEQK